LLCLAEVVAAVALGSASAFAVVEPKEAVVAVEEEVVVELDVLLHGAALE
jgi:hypothetical protein